jgi:hypothetical protein
MSAVCCNYFRSYIRFSWPPLWPSGQSSWLQKGDVLCFLWDTNWIYICFVEESRRPLWSSDQSSWLQIQRPGFDSRRYHIFREVVGQEPGPLSLVSTIEELLERKSSGSGLEIRECGCVDPLRWPRNTLYPQKLVLTSPTNDGRSVGIVLFQTQATEFIFAFAPTADTFLLPKASHYVSYPFCWAYLLQFSFYLALAVISSSSTCKIVFGIKSLAKLCC